MTNKAQPEVDLPQELDAIGDSIKALREAKAAGKLSINDQHLLRLCESTVTCVGKLTETVDILSTIVKNQSQALSNVNKTHAAFLDLMRQVATENPEPPVEDTPTPDDANKESE